MKQKILLGIALVAGLVLVFPNQIRSLVGRFSGAEVADRDGDLAAHATAEPESSTPGSVRHTSEEAATEGLTEEERAFLPPPIWDKPPAKPASVPPPAAGANNAPVRAIPESQRASHGTAPVALPPLEVAPEEPAQEDFSSSAIVLLPPLEQAPAKGQPSTLPQLLSAQPQPVDETVADASSDAATALPVDTKVANPSTEPNVVLFARDLVRMHAPDTWFVTETAAGRDVRLVLTPQEFSNEMKQGLWLCCHVLEGRPVLEAPDQMLTQRIAEVTEQRANNLAISTRTLGNWPGWQAEFDLPVKGTANATEQAAQQYRGFHFLAPTPWALVEGHAIYPADAPEAGEELRRLVASVQLNAPRAWPAQSTAATKDAELVYGVWKSSHGRFRIYGDGRIDLEKDQVLLLNTPASRQEAERLRANGPPRLRGTYQASGDILQVTWEDGSQLNLRWKTSHGKLLLTDHLGQISKLKPLLE